MATVTTPPKQPPIVNLPNILTTARLVLAIVLFVLIPGGDWVPYNWLWCLLVFVAAAVTDYLDGYLARKQGLTSTLGRNFDPLVDKVLICGAYIFLLPVIPDEIAPWMVTVVVARELLITGLRGYMESQGVNFGADWLGKIKMGLQCAALIAIFTVKAFAWPEALGPFLTWVQTVLIYAMVAATALSGAQYLWKAAALVKRNRER